MKLTLKGAIAALYLTASFAAPVAAGPLEDAIAAYGKGNYATALLLLRPLAEQGNRHSPDLEQPESQRPNRGARTCARASSRNFWRLKQPIKVPPQSFQHFLPLPDLVADLGVTVFAMPII
jgi:hypothetical protein